MLGRWGPNHAADPIITRWSRDGNGQQILNKDTNKPILQFVGIQRFDSGEWAIPGVCFIIKSMKFMYKYLLVLIFFKYKGMVDAGEKAQETARREFLEEAMDSENLSAENLQKLRNKCAKLFASGQEVRCLKNTCLLIKLFTRGFINC